MAERVTKKEIGALLDRRDYQAIIDRLITVSDQRMAVRGPGDAFRVFSKYRAKPVEQFLVATFDGAHKLIAVHVITTGIADKTLAHPREVFLAAVTDRASAIITAHNHPSGQLEPSAADFSLHKRIEDAGKLMGIDLLDEFVITNKGAISLVSGDTYRY